MRKIGKVLAIATTAAALGGAGLAIAQTGGPGSGLGYGMMGNGPGGGGTGWMMGNGPGAGYGPGGMHGGYDSGSMRGWAGGPGGFASDPSAWLDALKAELDVRPDQQAAWDAYAKAVEDAASQGQATWRGVDFDKLRAMDWQQHQALMAKLFNQRAAAFKTVQDAGIKLMAALDDSQKARLLTAGPGYGGPGRFGALGGLPCQGFAYGMMGSGPGGGR